MNPVQILALRLIFQFLNAIMWYLFSEDKAKLIDTAGKLNRQVEGFFDKYDDIQS